MLLGALRAVFGRVQLAPFDGVLTAGRHPAARARSDIRAGDHRVRRQMALRTRSKSTCLRTTSNGSVTPIAAGSHVTDSVVQNKSGMWTIPAVVCGAIPAATGPIRSLFPISPGGSSRAAARPARSAADAGSRTRCRRGSPGDDAPGTGRRSCSPLCGLRAAAGDRGMFMGCFAQRRVHPGHEGGARSIRASFPGPACCRSAPGGKAQQHGGAA
jgi:hypothetical protein